VRVGVVAFVTKAGGGWDGGSVGGGAGMSMVGL
jgi:hypothetical protein